MSARTRPGLLSEVLASRWTCAGIAVAAAAHVGLLAVGAGGWPCPIRAATGLPCPGCGLGRACAALLHGQWAEALRIHAFAPVALGFMALCLTGACVGEATRARLVARLEKLERRVPIAALVLGALLVYWIARLVLDAVAGHPLVHSPPPS